MKATSLGSYVSNHGIIILPEKSSFWKSKDGQNVFNFSVFAHEYFHFLHNFSTITGLYEFIVQIKLTRLYCATVDEAGLSQGESLLEGNAKDEAKRLTKWLHHLRGGIFSNIISNTEAHPPYLNYLRTEGRVTIGIQTIEYCGIAVHFGKTSNVELKIALGSTVLMETCAFEAQCAMFEKIGDGEVQAKNFRRSVPLYPYQTGRAIFEGVAGYSPSSDFLCRLCILALQCTNPGEAFISLAESCKNSGALTNQNDLMTRFVSQSESLLQSIIPQILKDSLRADIAPFTTRGISGKGLCRMAEWAERLFEERMRTPFFEIDAITAMPNLEPFFTLLKNLPVCPIFLEVDSISRETDYTFFSEEEPGQEIANELGAAQALLQLTMSHLSEKSTFVDTSKVANCACYFTNSCQAPLAVVKSPICTQTPWKSFQPEAAGGCWFAVAVGESRTRAARTGST